jgi:hypothetical protein
MRTDCRRDSPVAACRAGRGRIEAVSFGVGSESAAGVAPSQKAQFGRLHLVVSRKITVSVPARTSIRYTAKPRQSGSLPPKVLATTAISLLANATAFIATSLEPTCAICSALCRSTRLCIYNHWEPVKRLIVVGVLLVPANRNTRDTSHAVAWDPGRRRVACQ